MMGAGWENKSGKALTRTQLPLTLAWGITIHKSQGLTLEKVVVELGHADFSAGLSFVTIQTRFAHSQLKKPKETDSMVMLRLDTEHRHQLGFTLNTNGMDLSEYIFED